ncbi:unnamed protein product, partial [Amoebophrya sp. A25]
SGRERSDSEKASSEAPLIPPSQEVDALESKLGDMTSASDTNSARIWLLPEPANFKKMAEIFAHMYRFRLRAARNILPRHSLVAATNVIPKIVTTYRTLLERGVSAGGEDMRAWCSSRKERIKQLGNGDDGDSISNKQVENNMLKALEEVLRTVRSGNIDGAELVRELPTNNEDREFGPFDLMLRVLPGWLGSNEGMTSEEKNNQAPGNVLVYGLCAVSRELWQWDRLLTGTMTKTGSQKRNGSTSYEDALASLRKSLPDSLPDHDPQASSSAEQPMLWNPGMCGLWRVLFVHCRDITKEDTSSSSQDASGRDDATTSRQKRALCLCIL